MGENLRDLTLKLHFESRAKFSYYVMGLSLAILGFSIQFSEPSITDHAPSLVFLSWGAFIITLLSGFCWQRFWIRIMKRMHSDLTRFLSARPEETENKDYSSGLETEISELYQQLNITENIQLGSFIFGLLLLAIFKIINFYG